MDSGEADRDDVKQRKMKWEAVRRAKLDWAGWPRKCGGRKMSRPILDTEAGQSGVYRKYPGGYHKAWYAKVGLQRVAKSRVQETLDWLDKDYLAIKDEFETKQEDLESVVNPILIKICQCLDGRRSTGHDSCIAGTKVFAPWSCEDW